MKEHKTGAKKQSSPQGVRISPALHDLFSQAAKNQGLNIGEAYTVAVADWLRKNSTGAVIRAMIEEACVKNPELRASLTRSISKAS